MKYYVDVTLLPGADIVLYFLWGKVYQQLHLALVEQQNENRRVNIGVSFPNYRFDEEAKSLGGKLRLCAPSENELEKLDLLQWLSRLSDYVHIASIKPIPSNINEFAIFSRYQPKGTSKERLARRRAKRHNETYEKALEHFQGLELQEIREPFVRLKSLSSGHDHCLFIRKKRANSAVNEGFSSYGLSAVSTVPDF